MTQTSSALLTLSRPGLRLALFAACSALSPTALAHSSAKDSDENEASYLFRIPKTETNRLQGILAGLDVLGHSDSGRFLIVKSSQAVLGSLAGLGGQPDTFHVHEFESIQSTDGYMKPDELLQRLEGLAAENPAHLRLEEIGRSREGRPIMAMVIGKGDSKSKPSVFFNGMHHARELMTSEVTLSIIEAFAEAAQDPSQDPELAGWLDDYRIIVAPQMNPDGNSLVHNGRRLWRKNAWREKDDVVGVDLNRNYPAGWGSCAGSSGNKYSDTFRGPTPASEPESQALMNLVGRYKPAMTISYHSFSELIIFPYGCENVENPSRQLFESVATTMNSEITDDRGRKGSYDVGTAPELLYNADGSDIDWQWEAHGVLAYTIELNSSRQGFQPDYDQWRDITVQNQEGGWRALIGRLDGPRISGRLLLSTPELKTGKLHYTVSVLSNDGSAKPFAPSGPRGENKRFAFQRESDALHFLQILNPGHYRIDIHKGDVLAASLKVQLGNDPVDLGAITL